MNKNAHVGIAFLASVLFSIPAVFAQGFAVPGGDVGEMFASFALAIGVFALIIAIADGFLIGMLERRGHRVRKEVHITIIAVLVIVFVLSMLQSLVGIELPTFTWTFAFVVVVVTLIPAGWEGAQYWGRREIERHPTEALLEMELAEAGQLKRAGRGGAAAKIAEEEKMSEAVLENLRELEEDYNKLGESEEAMKILKIRRGQVESLRTEVVINELAELFGEEHFRKFGSETRRILIDLLKVKREFDVEAFKLLKGELARARSEISTQTGERHKLEKKKIELLERTLKELGIEARIDAIEGKIAMAEARTTVFEEKKEAALEKEAEEAEKGVEKKEKKFEEKFE